MASNDFSYHRILLVDDNENNLFVLNQIISQHFPDVELVEAKSGYEALSYVNSQEIDIILMDVQMPEMDGFETAKLIHGRKKTSQIPIIFITAFDPDHQKMKMGIEVGGIDYLTKPINDNELIRLLLLYQRFIKREREIHREIEAMNINLSREIQERIKAEQVIRKLNEELETRVSERTINLKAEIEERKKIETQLKASQTELTIVNLSLKEAIDEVKKVNQTKSLFLASMSHEIRTPMNSILGFTELMLTAETDESKKEKLEIIHYSGNHLLGLINDILDLSKIEAGKVEMHPIPLNIHKLLNNIYNIMKVKADEKQIEFEVNCTKLKNIIVLTDEQKLSQILINLISNAIKFTDTGRVKISTLYENEILHIDIEDTGIGIPEDKLDSIFEAFEQVYDPAKVEKEGTGLGLAITRKLVQLMEGTITVCSSLGKGTTFVVHLPMKISEIGFLEGNTKKHKPATPTLSPHDFTSQMEKLHILVVDDNNINQVLMQSVLLNLNLNSNIVSDGQLALEYLESNPCDLIFLDIQMPVMDGLETIARLRTNPNTSEIYVIALTANAMEGEEAKYISAGFNDCLTKPFRLDVLREKLVTFLTLR